MARPNITMFRLKPHRVCVIARLAFSRVVLSAVATTLFSAAAFGASLKDGANWDDGEIVICDYRGGIAEASEAIRRNPSDPAAFHKRGMMNYARGDHKQAIADYDEAIRLDPRNAQVFDQRGIARQAMRDYDGAIADYTEADRLDPKNTAALRNRIVAYAAKGAVDRVERDFIVVVWRSPELAFSLLFTATIAVIAVILHLEFKATYDEPLDNAMSA